MVCKKPFRKGIIVYGCGQCMPCRINRSRIWIGRMLLEAMEHPASCFVTLTYSPEFVPKDGSVRKKALQLFLKRLRELLSPRQVRYYAVGEYGSRTWRPHYHLVLFGVACSEEERLRRCWPFGFVHVGVAEKMSMQYCAGYVMKGMTNRKDRRLDGKAPEFCLMSRKPGIGALAVERFRKAYATDGGEVALSVERWIGRGIRAEGKTYPFGRYIGKKVADAVGLSEKDRKEHLREWVARVATEQEGKTVTEVEKERKAKISQQEGRCRPLKGGTL